MELPLDPEESNKPGAAASPANCQPGLSTPRVHLDQLVPVRLQIRRHFRRVALVDSPYWDSRSQKTCYARSQVFVARAMRESEEEPFRLLFELYIRNCQPITYIERICPQFLPVKLVRRSPDLLGIIHVYALPKYKATIEAIRAEVAQRRIWLSFSMEEFEQGDTYTLMPHRDGKLELGHYLFVTVGLSGVMVPDKWLLKVVRLLEKKDDDLGDAVFERVFFDTLKLLWPNGDHLTQARSYLTHLIADPALELAGLVAKLATKHPQTLSHLLYAPYVPHLLHSIEANIRRRHRRVTDVIDTVRMEWSQSPAFRNKYKRLSSESFTPPASFYQSARFYVAHFFEAQRGILKWKSLRFDDLVAHSFSEPQFKEFFEYFDDDAGELLEKMELAATAQPEVLSCQLANLFAELVQMHQDLLKTAEGDSLVLYTQWYREMVLETIGGEAVFKSVLASGDYQLLKKLFQKLFATRPPSVAIFARTRLTQYFTVLSIYKGDFHFPGKLPTRNGVPIWQPPLDASQMRRAFPKFWHLFRLFHVPLLWKYLEQCAVLYCYAEVTKEEEEEQKKKSKMVGGGT